MNRRHRIAMLTAFAVALVASSPGVRAERQNDVIGFTTNHVFEGALAGENVDILSGNLNIAIPLGPRYTLSDTFSYQVTLYYNSKIWEHDCRDIIPPAVCEGTVVAPSHYGVGFNIGFGRIYRDDRDKPDVYKYQEANGAEHYFSSSGNGTESLAADGSGIKIRRNGTNDWDVYPGDGTKLRLTHYTTGSLGEKGWHTAEILSREMVDGLPAYKVMIGYLDSGAIDYIRDYTLDAQNREIDFTYAQDGAADRFAVTLAFPRFGVGPAAEYVLHTRTHSFRDPIITPNTTASVQALVRISYPSISEEATFDYGLTEPGLDYGYLQSRTLPTGALIKYGYRHYKTSDKVPLHSELVLRSVVSSGKTYNWTYCRFEDGPDSGLDAFLQSQDGQAFHGTNPYKVRVRDPFNNLTVYNYHYRLLYDVYDCSNNGECSVAWTDGLLYSQETYLGPDESRLVERQEYFYTYGPDPNVFGGWFEYRQKNSTKANVYSIPVAVRAYKTVRTQVARTLAMTDRITTELKEQWAGLPLQPKKTSDYLGSALYRTTYNEPDTTDFWLRGKSKFTEIWNASEQKISRTDRYYSGNRIECEVRRKDPSTATELPSCSAGIASGDVVVRSAFDDSQGGLVSTVTSGGDDANLQTVEYHFDHGSLARKAYDLSVEWSAIERTIDQATGLTATSLSPDGITTTYTWDELGRLTTIAPRPPEAPTVISYPTLRLTTVRQELSSDDGIESVYLYDDLGRLYEVRRKNITGGYDVQFTEYDIAGRILRKSEWAPIGSSDLKWTTYDYTAAVGPETDANGIEIHYPDPLGRLHQVTDPAGNTVQTNYDGTRTTTTVSGIAAAGGGFLTAVTSYDKDGLGRLIRVDAPGTGADATYEYDERDNLTRVELLDGAPPATTQVRRFEYDALGRLRLAANPENGTVEYLAYDARGNLLQYRDAKFQTFTNSYDQADRLISRSVNFGGGATALLLQNTYDIGTGAVKGKLTRQESYRAVPGINTIVSTNQFLYGDVSTSSSCSIGLLGYAGLNGRLSKQITQLAPWSVALTTELCQDALGLPYLTKYPDVSNSSRTRSRVASLYRNGYLFEMHDLGRNLEYIRDIVYAPGGVATSIARGNHLSDETWLDNMYRPSRMRVLSYQGSREPLDTMVGCEGGIGPQHIRYCGNLPETAEPIPLWDSGAYVYDGAGNIKTIGSNAYGYDQLSRLVAATLVSEGTVYGETFQYDAFGNMIQTARQVGGPVGLNTPRRVFAVDMATNRLQTLAIDGNQQSSYHFDENGSMTIAGPTAYTLTGDGRLDKISDSAHGQIARYDYDANGYRVRAETGGMEVFYVRDQSGQVLSEFQRTAGSTSAPVWNKDYVYALGKSFSLIKNDTPQTPLKPIASSVTFDSVTVTWTAVNEPDLLGYKLERYRDDELTPTSWTPDEGFVSFLDDDFGLALKLRYRLYAMDTAGNLSGASADLVVRPSGSGPPSPTGLTATSSDRRVDLSWTGVSDDDLLGYFIERCVLPACSNWVSVNSVPITLTAFTDAGLTNGTTYRYRVRAKDTSNRQSSPSNTVDAEPQDFVRPARPVGVSAFALLDSSSIRITWEPNQDDDLASYHVFRSTVSGVPGAEVTLAGSIDTNPVIGSMNYYTVIAADSSGNLSDPSAQVAAFPRSATGPAGLAAAFEVDDRGTPPFPPGTLSPDSCDVSYWFDDIVQVRLTWTTEPGATYRIYRRGLTDTDFAPIGTSTSSPYLDVDPPGHSFTYVVAKVLGAGESKGSNVAAATDAFTTNVANLYAADGRNLFPTDNAPGRAAIISWSPVREKLLRGYHVYRRCARRDGDFQNVFACPMGLQNAGGSEGNWCESRWVRLTDQPLSASTTTYQDSTLQGLEGCYTYMVRPVALEPALLEGPVTKAALFYARSEADSGSFPVESVDLYNQHCSRDAQAWDRFLIPGCTDGTALGDVCVNGHPRLNGDPGGVPHSPGGNTPSAVQVQKGLCTHHGYPTGGTCAANGNCVPDLHRELKGDMIIWPQSPESDLKGYYIEKAGSASGPWVRITPHPIAWWETSYCVGATSVQILAGETDTEAGWSGMTRCDHYRVIAVDEEGNESTPTVAYELNGPTAAECPETPPAPQNLRVECDPYYGDCSLSGPSCRVMLRWYAVSGGGSEPVRYNVYRMVNTTVNGPHFFYKTGEYDNNGCCNVHIEAGDPVSCPYGDDLAYTRCNTGHLEAYYVTAQYRVDGVLKGESPPSRIVYWDCDTASGYVTRFADSPQEDFFALEGQEDSELICRNTPRQLDLTVATSAGQRAPSKAVAGRSFPPDLLRAPMQTLGAAFNPPWILQDLHTDHLGSVRLITDDTGNIVSRHDYFPFGEEVHAYAGVYNTHAFTGHERDGSGLDYMKARYYAGNLGRFLTVDPGFDVHRESPQSWNLYSYVRNRPINVVDPSGSYGRGSGWTDSQWNRFDASQQEAAKDAEEAAAELEAAADEIENKKDDGELSKDTEKTKKEFEKKTGKGTNVAERMRDAASSLRDSAKALRDDGTNGYLANAVSLPPGSFAGHAERFSKVAEINTAANRFYSNYERKHVAGHEALHSAGLGDQFYGEHAVYRESGWMKKLAEDYPEKALKNPDNLLWFEE